MIDISDILAELDGELSASTIPVEVRRQVLEQRIGQLQAKGADLYHTMTGVAAEHWGDERAQRRRVSELKYAFQNVMRALAENKKELDAMPLPEVAEMKEEE